MKVAFSTSTNISFDRALSAAKLAYPEVDFGDVKDSRQLYEKLSGLELVLFVDVDPTEDFKLLLEGEDSLAKEIDAKLDECHDPDVPQIIFEEGDIPDDPFCGVEDLEDFEVPDAGSIDDLLAELNDMQAKMDGGLSEGKGIDDLDPNSQIGSAVKCIREMERITAEMKVLLDRENKIRNTKVNFEQLLYNYRIMEKYYQQKIDTLDGILGTFKPLLEQKRRLENVQIPNKNLEIVQRQNDLQTYVSSIYPGTQRPTAMETQIEDDITRLQNELVSLQNELRQVDDTILLEKNNVYSFNFKQLQENDLASRRAFLLLQLTSLFSGSQSVFERSSQFSSRLELRPTSTGNTEELSFTLTIQHETQDEAGILRGRDLSFIQNDGFGKFESYKPGVPSGILYTRLYNIWGDVDEFFTREERGLTTDSNHQDSSLKNTGVGPVNGNYISNLTVYEEFYTKFAQKHEAKTKLVKDTIIEPALSSVQEDMISFATREVQLLLSFGKTFEDLPAESGILQNIIKSVRDAAGIYVSKLNACKATYEYIVQQHNQVILDIEKKQQEYTTVSCAGGDKGTSNPPEPGSDPLGNNMGEEDPSNPNPTKWCYWLKFSAMATAVNLLPLPGPGGYKYWPIGYVIPSVNGLIKIPLPIVWIPVAAIALPVGMFVIFIGQCGICPSPFVFYVGADGEKKFIVSLRPTEKFGSDSSDGIFKTIDKGGIAIRKKMVDMVNDIKVKVNGQLSLPPGFGSVRSDDKNTVLSDLKENILRKVNKIGNPDMSRMRAIQANASVLQKRDAFKKTVKDYLDKMVIPDIKLPKNASSVNPKPTPVAEVIEQFKKAAQMKLPQISVPATEQISLKQKFIAEINKIKAPAVEIAVPHKSSPDFDKKKDEFIIKLKAEMKKIASSASKAITPESLGILQVATGEVVFLNPYKCKQTAKGFAVQPLPPTVVTALATVKGLSDALIDSIDSGRFDLIIGKLADQSKVSVTGNDVKALFVDQVDKAMPEVRIPNLSKASIRELLKSGSLSLAAIQLPSIPDPTQPPQIRIFIPGKVVKAALIEAVMSTLDSFDVVNIDFTTLSSIDAKQLVIDIVEGNFRVLDATVGPFLNIINKYKSAKNKKFSELLGLPKINKDDDVVESVDINALERAKSVLKKIELVPYPAVAVAPQVFKNLHPILVADDLPPWERLTVKNFLFIVFLNSWCEQGKKGGGFFENP